MKLLPVRAASGPCHTSWIGNLLGLLVGFAAISAAAAQPSDMARIERHGDSAVLTVNTFRPLDAIATQLGSQFGIAVSAEDPIFQFRGDMMDISREDHRLRPGTLVPARWGLEVQFPVDANGAPRNRRELLAEIIAEANRRSPFAYRLDEDGDLFFVVPTRTRDAQGRSIAMIPLLDRLVTIPPGRRRINESAALMADDLSRQTGLRVSCCQSSVGGIPWGVEEVTFGANHEPARSVLRRLGLTRWHARCDEEFCTIDQR